MNRAALILAIVAATAPAACGGGSGAGTDAGTDAAPGGDAAVDVTALTCDPAAQNCAAGSECDFGCDGDMAAVACRPDNGSGALGDACSPTAPCAKGSGCVTRPVVGSACLKYCAGDGDCATGERCHNDTLFVRCGGPETGFLLHYCY